MVVAVDAEAALVALVQCAAARLGVHVGQVDVGMVTQTTSMAGEMHTSVASVVAALSARHRCIQDMAEEDGADLDTTVTHILIRTCPPVVPWRTRSLPRLCSKCQSQSQSQSQCQSLPPRL